MWLIQKLINISIYSKYRIVLILPETRVSPVLCFGKKRNMFIVSTEQSKIGNNYNYQFKKAYQCSTQIVPSRVLRLAICFKRNLLVHALGNIILCSLNILQFLKSKQNQQEISINIWNIYLLLSPRCGPQALYRRADINTIILGCPQFIIIII